jgi:Holliday junction resolvasome RuvABC DNA-binding subunit
LTQKVLNKGRNINEKAARRLWLSVLRLAISDATQIENQLLRKNAIAYLKSEDSALAFLALGCDQNEAREKILTRLELPAAA